jgi:hypothetical protein
MLATNYYLKITRNQIYFTYSGIILADGIHFIRSIGELFAQEDKNMMERRRL